MIKFETQAEVELWIRTVSGAVRGGFNKITAIDVADHVTIAFRERNKND